ncbi:MAG: ABC transporter ATP-binding protein, partial [Thiomicrorhabdus sp.]|nr:ABC transporter ATP-binding protein [Thiomicrorhabdus sp.]
MAEISIKVENLVKTFGEGESRVEVIKGASFEVNKGELVALIAPSGAGKSTLLMMIGCVLEPTSGKIWLGDELVYDKTWKTKDARKIRREKLGFIFQAHYLFKGMTALMNVEIATLLSNEKIDNVLLERLEIKELMQQKIGELSGGQQQRVSIARVLSKKPKVIFADEPTGNLDKETAKLVMEVLLEYIEKENAALILVTHDEEMAKLCNKAYRLEQQMLS